MRLSHKDFDVVHRTLLELYVHRDLAAFRNALPGILLKVIPLDHSGLGRYTINPPRVPAKMVHFLESDRGKDLSERERLILNLLRPHFIQAYQNAQLVTAQGNSNAMPLSPYDLSPREGQIARWLAQGKSNPEIALILQISPRTVEKHME